MPKPATPGRDTGYVISLIAALATFLGGLAYANFRFEPYAFDRRAWAQVVRDCIEPGRHFKYRDINVAYRLLRREEVRAMRETPEIVFAGSSHHQHLSDAIFPGYKMRNLFIHQPNSVDDAVTLDSLADTFAIPELLYRANKLPKLYVMALTPNPKRRDRKGDRLRNDWRYLSEEYAAMAQRLGVKPPNPIAAFHKDYYQNLLSAKRLTRTLELRNQYPDSDVCTDETKGELSVLHPDGSLTKSAKQRKKESFAAARKQALEMGRLEREYRITIEPEIFDAVSRLLHFLKREGVQVVIFITPHNPLYLKGIEGTQYRRDMEAYEAALHQLAKEHGLTVAGSFDHAKTDCDETDYYDPTHVTERCAAKILRKAVALEPRPNTPEIPLGRYDATAAERGGATMPADGVTAKKEGR